MYSDGKYESARLKWSIKNEKADLYLSPVRDEGIPSSTR